MILVQGNALSIPLADKSVLSPTNQARLCWPAIVQFLDFACKFIALGDFVRINDAARHINGLAPSVHHTECANNDSILTRFTFSEIKQEFSLSAFYSEIWQKSIDNLDRLFICHALGMKHLTVLCAWLFDTSRAAKVFAKQVNRFRLDLFYTNLLGVNCLGCVPSNAHVVSRSLDRKVSISVKNSSKISLDCFIHAMCHPLRGLYHKGRR